jgi:hypothetical protein
MDRQEELDRRALDRHEAQWIEAARRRGYLSGKGPAWPFPDPMLRMRIERAEAGERLRRELRRDTLEPWPVMGPTPAPRPFRLR